MLDILRCWWQAIGVRPECRLTLSLRVRWLLQQTCTVHWWAVGELKNHQTRISTTDCTGWKFDIWKIALYFSNTYIKNSSNIKLDFGILNKIVIVIHCKKFDADSSLKANNFRIFNKLLFLFTVGNFVQIHLQLQIISNACIIFLWIFNKAKDYRTMVTLMKLSNVMTNLKGIWTVIYIINMAFELDFCKFDDMNDPNSSNVFEKEFAIFMAKDVWDFSIIFVF